MALSNKHQRFVNEYLLDLDPAAAYVRAGYSPNGARQAAYKLLQKPEIKAAIEERFDQARISSQELINRLDKMAMGQLPTKRVTGSHARAEFDTLAAADKLARIYALFQDKVELEISHLNITDD